MNYNTPLTYGTIVESVARSLVPSDEPLPAALELGSLVRAYDEQVHEVDAVVGEFLEALARLPFYDDAVVVVSADHGESMADHGALFRHLRDEMRYEL